MGSCAPRRPIGTDLPGRFARWWPLEESTVLGWVLDAYAAPDRGYHDLEHLREVLERVDEVVASESVGEVDLLRLGAFFHDVVYRTAPGAEVTNEEASAQYAHAALADRLSERDVSRVAELVRATYDHRVSSDDRAAAVLMDADLAILAADPERYRRYVAGVRREYAWAPDPEFRRGRAEILTDLVRREHLFHTAYARQAWEAAARTNIAAELAVLTAE